MLVVLVFFEIKSAHISEFRSAIIKNATASIAQEEGCRQFDVAQDQNDNSKFFLYELYDDEAAFELHKNMQHFRDFDALTASWTTSKSVKTFHRIAAPS
ncbi:MAG: putative quinol monooxygenase [Hyphomicrobiaceae bacterium]